MSTIEDLKRLLERNNIDPAHFDLEGFRNDQLNFAQSVEKMRALNPAQTLAPVLSVHQVLKGKAS